MTRTKLHLLLFLLKAYRSHLCFGDDRYAVRANEMIRDVRFAINNRGFYHIDRMQIAEIPS